MNFSYISNLDFKLLSFLQLLRFDEVSRLHTINLTFIVPFILVIFRNSEFISTVLGRNPTKENFICFNLKPDSVLSLESCH